MPPHALDQLGDHTSREKSILTFFTHSQFRFSVKRNVNPGSIERIWFTTGIRFLEDWTDESTWRQYSDIRSVYILPPWEFSLSSRVSGAGFTRSVRRYPSVSTYLYIFVYSRSSLRTVSRVLALINALTITGMRALDPPKHKSARGSCSSRARARCLFLSLLRTWTL